MASADQPATTADPRRPMRADARRNYERLVEVAREVFTEQGPEAPLDEIARRAGVGAGTLYRHFPGRDSLIEAVYRADIAAIAAEAHRLLDELPPGEALAAWLRHQLDFTVRAHGLAASLKAAIDQDSETFAWCRSTLSEAAATVLGAARDAGAVRTDVTPTTLLRLVHGIGMVTATAAPGEPDKMLNVLLDGLRPPRD
jgi:AcrR family transcriptional regulator